MPDCEDCKGYPLIDRRIKDVEKFKDKLETPGNGTIDRIWTAIDATTSRAFVITVAAIVIAFVGTLFTLVYNSNQNILMQFIDIKSEISAISKVIEIRENDRHNEKGQGGN